MTERPRWHDVVITTWILALAVVGMGAIWGESIYNLWVGDEEAEAETETRPEAPRGPRL